jgi:hypothetical protein
LTRSPMIFKLLAGGIEAQAIWANPAGCSSLEHGG